MIDLEKFIRDFRFRSLNVKRERPHVSYTYGAPNTASYYTYQDEVVELEIDKRELENLVNVCYRADHFLNKETHENYLRNKHPAIADAYSKYQMLLALYR